MFYRNLIATRNLSLVSQSNRIIWSSLILNWLVKKVYIYMYLFRRKENSGIKNDQIIRFHKHIYIYLRNYIHSRRLKRHHFRISERPQSSPVKDRTLLNFRRWFRILDLKSSNLTWLAYEYVTAKFADHSSNEYASRNLSIALSFRSRIKYVRGKIQYDRYISQNAAHILSFLFLNLEYVMCKSGKKSTLRLSIFISIF